MPKNYGLIFSQSHGCPKVPIILWQSRVTTNGLNCCGKFQAIFSFPKWKYIRISKDSPSKCDCVQSYDDCLTKWCHFQLFPSNRTKCLTDYGVKMQCNTHCIFITISNVIASLATNSYGHTQQNHQNRNYFSRIGIMIFDFGHVHFTKSMFSP